MIKVGDTAAARRGTPRPAIGAHGLRLPASFDGRPALPGLRGAALPAEPLAGPGLPPAPELEAARTCAAMSIGRWSVDPDTPRADAARRRGGPGVPDHRRRTGCGLPGRGRAATTRAIHADRRARVRALRPAPAAARHADLRRRGGALHRVPDRAGLSAGPDDGDYEALEHAYLAAGAEAGGPIMASFDGGIVSAPEDGGGRRHARRRCWSSASSASGRARPASAPMDKASLDQHLLEDPAARRHRGRGRRGPARAEPDPARGRSALHRDGRLQPDRRRLHARTRTGWPSAPGRRR